MSSDGREQANLQVIIDFITIAISGINQLNLQKK